MLQLLYQFLMTQSAVPNCYANFVNC